MGHSQLAKAQNHQRIVEIAGQRLRETGLHGIGLAELMKEAGLTVGGFYKHFESREALVGEALEAALGYWQAALQSEKGPTFAGLIDDYLSESHRDRPGTGCVLAALAGDIARADERTRDLCTEKIREQIELLAGLAGGGSGKSGRALAILTYSALVGAISLARAVNDDLLSREILDSVKKSLRRRERDRKQGVRRQPGKRAQRRA
jgi:TetR/AcrR family transcriptional regulator, transcriptional repressor for nem operon